MAKHESRRPELDASTPAAIVDDYQAAQLRSLKAGLLAAGLFALASLAFTGGLPSGLPEPTGATDQVVAVRP